MDDGVRLYSPKQAQKLLLGFKSNFLTFQNIQSDSDQGWGRSRGDGEHIAFTYVNYCLCRAEQGIPQIMSSYLFTSVFFPRPFTRQRIRASKKLCLAQRLSWQNMALTSDLFEHRAHTSAIIVGHLGSLMCRERTVTEGRTASSAGMDPSGTQLSLLLYEYFGRRCLPLSIPVSTVTLISFWKRKGYLPKMKSLLRKLFVQVQIKCPEAEWAG